MPEHRAIILLVSGFREVQQLFCLVPTLPRGVAYWFRLQGTSPCCGESRDHAEGGISAGNCLNVVSQADTVGTLGAPAKITPNLPPPSPAVPTISNCSGYVTKEEIVAGMEYAAGKEYMPFDTW